MLAAILLIWIVIAWPLVSGERMLVLRDVLTTHVPYKWFGAQALARGEIPAVNPTWGLGQPFRGNPNAAPLYPGNLLYLALPFWSAFALHYMLHWLLGFVGMRGLARALGQREEAAVLAGLAYAGSGFFLSLLSFYNLLAVGAWAPFVLWALVRGGRRGVAAGGLACGMMLLGGEPISAALVIPAMLLAAAEGRRWRSAFVMTAAVGALGLLVALPQVIASARVVGFSFRATHGFDAAQATLGALPLGRFLELVLPLPWGWPSEVSTYDYWSNLLRPRTPYFFSLHFGIVAAVLAAGALERRRWWAALALGCLFLGWAGGHAGEITRFVGGGYFRFPQKLLLPFTLAAALLAGWGLERATADAGERRATGRRLALAGSILFAAALLGRLFYAPFRELLRTTLARDGDEALAAAGAAHWIVDAGIVGLVLLLAAWAVRRRPGAAPALVVVAQLVALLPLAPLLQTEARATYRDPSPLARAIAEPRTVAQPAMLYPPWEPMPVQSAAAVGRLSPRSIYWLELWPAFGIPFGLDYPMAPDLEGLTSPLTVFVNESLGARDWAARVAWMRRLGIGWIVRQGTEPVPGLERMKAVEQAGSVAGLDRVLDPAPKVRWPDRIAIAKSPVEGFLWISRGALGTGGASTAIAVASRAVDHVGGARVSLVEEDFDRLLVDVDGGGGLLVVERAWLPIYLARLADGTALRTQPADVELLGVEVPAGRQRVEIYISSRPEKIAGAVALLVAATLFAILLRSPRTAPARTAG